MSKPKRASLRFPLHHETCVNHAKKAIDNVFSDTTVDKEKTYESLLELRNHITVCIQAIK